MRMQFELGETNDNGSIHALHYIDPNEIRAKLEGFGLPAAEIDFAIMITTTNPGVPYDLSKHECLEKPTTENPGGEYKLVWSARLVFKFIHEGS